LAVTGVAVVFSACGSPSAGNGGDAGIDVSFYDAKLDTNVPGFDRSQDVPPIDSGGEGSAFDVADTSLPDVVGTEDIAFDSATEDVTTDAATEDVLFDGATEDIPPLDGATEDVMFDGATEDIFFDAATEDVDTCPLPDADTSVFPPACASCLEESCCTQLTACEGDPGCQSIANCIGQCLTKKETNCALNCYNAGDAGKSVAVELLNCINADCGSSAEGACD
jgi:hypothetical protein